MKILILTISLIFLICIPVIAQTDKELYYPPPYEENYYIVQKGDCLSSIAQKLWHNMNRWKELWGLNKWIENPNLIIPGWKLTISKVTVNKEDYCDQLTQELKQKVFKIKHMEFETKSELIKEFKHHKDTIIYCNLKRHTPYYAINSVKNILEALYPLELHDVIDNIILVTAEDDWWDMPVLMAALAWQEGGFGNHTGRHGEKGYFQMKPETAQTITENIDTEELTHSLEFNTAFATQLTYEYLCQLKNESGSWRGALTRYNGSGPLAERYAGAVIKKFHSLKRMKIN